MAMNPNVVAEQDARIASLAHTRAFLMVAGALPGLFAATSLENGVAIGVAAAVSIVVSAVLSHVLAGVTGVFSRVPAVLMLDAMVIVLLGFALRVLFPVVFQNLGVYLALTCAGGMAGFFVAQDGVIPAARRLTLGDAVCSAVLACVALAVCGLLSELLGTGSVLGAAVPFLSATPVAIFGKPAGGLLILAVLAAIVQALDGKGGSAKDAAAAEGGER